MGGLDKKDVFACFGIAALVGLAIVLIILFKKGKEAFVTRQDTIETATALFNPLTITTDIRKPNFAGTDDPAQIAEVNRVIAEATATPLMLPGGGGANGSGGTGLGAYSTPSPLKLPLSIDASVKAKLCAEVTNCDMLADAKYKECGFCVKGGTDFFKKSPGSYTGGLYMSAGDKADYDAARKPYEPTFGSCPPRPDGTQMFFSAREPCTRESNRQICREVGGFSMPNASKCALAPPTNSFVYQDPPNPSFSVFLRVTSPANARTTVEVQSNGVSIGTGEVNQRGDAVVALSNVKEGQAVQVIFNQPEIQGSRRGIAAQWEGGTNLRTPFDKTLTAISVNGTMSGLERRLRKMGSVGNSKQLQATTTSLMKSATWVWGANATERGLVVQAFVPGLFQDPTYAEDKFLQGSSPLIGKAATATALQVGPCNKPDQAPGSYSTDCLLDLFASSGGDPIKGGLVKSGLNALNQYGTVDGITNHLGELYALATTAKTSNGVAASLEDINGASRALFGFDVASPCETVVQNNDGTTGFGPKPAPLDVGCLNYLWTNTGNDRSRGNEDAERSSGIPNTYTSIQDRFSGLMSGESTPAKQAQYPFRTCQSKGTKAPVLPNGAPNWDAIGSVQALSVASVQDYYNTIYKTANYTVGNGTDNPTKAQQDALLQCYGVKKIPDASCGAL